MRFPRLSPLTFIIPGIMVAALTLGYYSYHAAGRIAARSEESVESSNRTIGLKLIDGIEKNILDVDRNLFWMVRLDDPREFTELWRRVVRNNPLLDTVIVLDENREIVHFVSKLTRPSLASFRRLFQERIIPDMELHSLPPDTHKHLHKSYDGSYYLISFVRQRSAGRDYYIALNMNLPWITNDIFRREAGDLMETKYVAVLDEGGRGLWGSPVETGGPLVFEQPFPTTLYLWRLQIAPREVKAIRRETRAQRRYNIVLVAIAVCVIIAGITVLLVAMRKERRTNQLKSDFVANVTHELKTPLTLIRMFAELISLKRGESNETSREYAEIITRESDRLTRLIDNVLDFARIERGKAAYQFSPGNLATVVERGVDLLQSRADQDGVKLRTEVEPDLPETLFDENAMTLLLVNLIDNALKYGSGTAEVTVTLRRQGEALMLRVVDHGPGIPKEELGRIFERFYRTKSARSKPIRGSGIGLSLVRHIAEAHGGGVHVESDLGKGAAFEVTIPVRGTRRAQASSEPDRRSSEG